MVFEGRPSNGYKDDESTAAKPVGQIGPNLPHMNSKSTKAIDAAKSILDMICTGAEAAPFPGIKESAAGLYKLLTMYQRYKENAESIPGLLESFQSLKVCLDMNESEEHLDTNLREQLKKLSDELETVYMPQLEALISPRWDYTFKAVSGIFQRFLFGGADEKFLLNVTSKINESLQRITWEAGCRNNEGINRLRKTTEDIWENDLLDQLSVARNASFAFDERSGCIPETRTRLLKDISKWSQPGSKSSYRVFWLHGSTGTGKSAIAYTVAETLAKDDSPFEYSGSFFCTPEYKIRQLVPTLAYQIGVRSKSFRPHLIATIEQDRDVGGANISVQFQKLLINTLRTVTSYRPSPIMLVIDGLDECAGSDDHKKIFLEELLQCVRKVESMKIFISCRATPQIKDILVREQDLCRSFSLDTDGHDIDGDIQRYICRELPSQYRGDGEVTRALAKLAKKARGSFLYASVMLDSLSKDRDDFLAQVNADDLEGADAVDARYERLIVKALEKEPNQELQSRLYSALAATAGCFQSPLSIRDIASLFDIIPARLLSFLKEFSTAHFEVRSLDAHAHFAHISFKEFLVARTSSLPSPGPTIPVQHYEIAIYTLRFMKKHLYRNFLQLSPDCHVRDIDLPSRIPSDLGYACQYWAYHLESGARDDTPLAVSQMAFGALKDFVRDEFLLYWLEMLCLLERLDLAKHSLEKAKMWVEGQALGSDHDVRVHEQLMAMTAAVATCEPFLEEYPLQVYEALLSPFNPATLHLRKVYYTHVKPFVEAVCVRSHKQVVPTGAKVSMLSLSIDGRLLAGYAGGSIRVWDALSGTLYSEQSPLSSGNHEYTLHHLLFISPRKIFTVLSDKPGKYVEITAWDCSQRQLRREPLLQETLEPEESGADATWAVTSTDQKNVAVSLRGRMIVWKTEPPKSPKEICRHRLATSTLLALSSRGCFISGDTLQSLKDTSVILDLGSELGRSIAYGAFSSNGSVFAVGTEDGEVHIWDAVTLQRTTSLYRGIPRQSAIALSSDGAYLAVLGSHVGIWKTDSMDERITKLKPTSNTFDFRFSSNSRYFKLACLATCGSVVIEAYGLDTPIESQVITAAAFAADGRLIATGSSD
ncbi:hypothetical protein V5O48_009669, partial [Marasmius crinis-equi]